MKSFFGLVGIFLCSLKFRASKHSDAYFKSQMHLLPFLFDSSIKITAQQLLRLLLISSCLYRLIPRGNLFKVGRVVVLTVLVIYFGVQMPLVTQHLELTHGCASAPNLIRYYNGDFSYLISLEYFYLLRLYPRLHELQGIVSQMHRRYHHLN